MSHLVANIYQFSTFIVIFRKKTWELTLIKNFHTRLEKHKCFPVEMVFEFTDCGIAE